MVFADSVNLARRLSAKNENDLVQENMMDSSKHNYKECMALSRKLSDLNQLPKECHVFNDVVSNVSSPSKSDASIAFQGMGSSAAAAVSARKKGQENYAQIQRRFTNTRRFTKDNK